MDSQNQHNDALFEQLGRSRKKKKRRVLTTVIAIVLIAALLLLAAVVVLRQRVRNKFGDDGDDVLRYEASVGTLHTLVSGTGMLEEVDLETLSVPGGVEILEVKAERNQLVSEGDILATVDMATVLQALADTQAAIDTLDEQISAAEGDKVSSTIRAGVSGRVKLIYGQKGSDVTACMAQNGALAVISLDGYLAVDIDTDVLTEGDSVSVRLPDGSEKTGRVDSVAIGTATVLISDDGPEVGIAATVLSAEGKELGSGELYIHRPLRITGYAGTIHAVTVKLNQKVSARTNVFTLTDTGFSTNYDTLLRQREEQEEILRDLLTIYQNGAILAPCDGLVSAIVYTEEESASVPAPTAAASSDMYAAYASAAAAEEPEASPETELLTLTPNEKVQVTIGIGESDILSLKVGQTAEVTVASVGDETAFSGVVTEVSKTADSSSGVTQYSAVVELEKTEGMLAGMSAEVGIQIEGVENAVLIPVDALHQTRDISFVYTSYDPETKQYGGLVEVETGLWGDEYVEIISGLKPGDVVCYTEPETFFWGFGNMGMPGGNRNNMPAGNWQNMTGGRK